MPPLRTSPGYWPRALGFTLAELLIALLILGVIAAFAIPKITAVQDNSQRKAILKETLSKLSEVATVECVRTKPVFSSLATYRDTVISNLNVIQSCSNASDCGAPDMSHPSARYVQLSNGVGLSVRNAGVLDIDLDWNGSREPNQYGEDRLRVYVNQLDSTRGGHPPCKMYSDSSAGSSNLTLYNSLWQ